MALTTSKPAPALARRETGFGNVNSLAAIDTSETKPNTLALQVSWLVRRINISPDMAAHVAALVFAGVAR
jgi:hypothetical protein